MLFNAIKCIWYIDSNLYLWSRVKAKKEDSFSSCSLYSFISDIFILWRRYFGLKITFDLFFHWNNFTSKISTPQSLGNDCYNFKRNALWIKNKHVIAMENWRRIFGEKQSLLWQKQIIKDQETLNKGFFIEL